MVSVENEIFPLRKYNKFHLLLELLLRVSCVFHCFIFPERNELLNCYVQRSHFFFGHYRRFSFFCSFFCSILCCFLFPSVFPCSFFFFCTMPFVPFFISFGHYLLYATQWRFFPSSFHSLRVFLSHSLRIDTFYLFAIVFFSSLCIFESLLHRSSTPKYALQSWGDGNSDNQKQSKWKWETKAKATATTTKNTAHTKRTEVK